MSRSDDVDPAFAMDRLSHYEQSSGDVLGILHERMTVQEVIGAYDSSGQRGDIMELLEAWTQSEVRGRRPRRGQNLSTVISGSYRRHLGEIYDLRVALESLGIEVVSPVGSGATNPGDEFIILDTDPIDDRRLLQDSIFAKLRMSSFLVLANVDGYVGSAASIEIGCAISLGLQVLTLEPVIDPSLAPYCRLLSDVFPSLADRIAEEG